MDNSPYNSETEAAIAHIGSFCQPYPIADEDFDTFFEAFALGYISSFISNPQNMSQRVRLFNDGTVDSLKILQENMDSIFAKIRHLFTLVECPVCGTSGVRFYSINAGNNCIICSKCAAKNKVILYPTGGMSLEPYEESEEDVQEEVQEVQEVQEDLPELNLPEYEIKEPDDYE